MKLRAPYLLLIFLLSITFKSCEQKKMILPSLKETYAKDDKKPFGGYIAYQQVRKIFSNNYVQPMYDPFEVDNTSDGVGAVEQGHSLYILVTKDLMLDYSDAEAMHDFVSQGNDLLISADYIDPIFLSKFDLNVERQEEVLREVKGEMKDTKVSIDAESHDTTGFGYYYFPALNYFSGYDFDRTIILGRNEKSKPNYIVSLVGRGRLYLHAAPRTFGNYFLLQDSNHVYLEGMLGYLRPDPTHVYWDEHYKFNHANKTKRPSSGSGGGSGNRDRDEQFSSFKVINQHASLKWALWLTLALLLLFVLFNMKRRQRIVPIVKPNENTTVAFTETIGRLYLQKKNNKNISEKMITYFYEHLRNKYFLSTTQLAKDFTTILARKSGVEVAQIETLFHTINSVQASPEVEDFQLLSLNEQIQNFYKNKN